MNSELVGANLKYLRLNSGLNQEQLAEDICVSRTAIQTYELGRPTIHILIRYKEKFNVSLDDLCFKDLSINPKTNNSHEQH